MSASTNTSLDDLMTRILDRHPTRYTVNEAALTVELDSGDALEADSLETFWTICWALETQGVRYDD